MGCEQPDAQVGLQPFPKAWWHMDTGLFACQPAGSVSSAWKGESSGPQSSQAEGVGRAAEWRTLLSRACSSDLLTDLNTHHDTDFWIG